MVADEQLSASSDESSQAVKLLGVAPRDRLERVEFIAAHLDADFPREVEDDPVEFERDRWA